MVHKAPASARRAAIKKHADAHVVAASADEDSILDVFAPAPISAPPAKVSHKTNEKSVVVAREKK